MGTITSLNVKTQRETNLIPALKLPRGRQAGLSYQKPMIHSKYFVSPLRDYFLTLCYRHPGGLEWQTTAAGLCRLRVSLIKGGSLHVGLTRQQTGHYFFLSSMDVQIGRRLRTYLGRIGE